MLTVKLAPVARQKPDAVVRTIGNLIAMFYSIQTEGGKGNNNSSN